MTLQEALGVWDVQANSQVLCPHSGVRLSVSHGGERARLELTTGHRTVFDVRRGGLLFGPAVVTEGDFSLRAISERELRDERRVSAARQTLASFGAASGVLTTSAWNRERWNLFAQTEAGQWVDVHRALRERAQAQRAAEEEARRAQWAAKGRRTPSPSVSALLAQRGLLVALSFASSSEQGGGEREELRRSSGPVFRRSCLPPPGVGRPTGGDPSPHDHPESARDQALPHRRYERVAEPGASA